MTGADIYIVIRQGNKYYTYKSTDQPGWPPSEQDIVRTSGQLRKKPLMSRASDELQTPPFQWSPKDFETLNDKDDDGNKGGRGKEGGEREDRGQIEESEFKGSKANY